VIDSGAGNTYFRKGFGLRSDVQGLLSTDYDGELVDLLRANDFTLSAGGLTIRLAREFGFCYGVERAVDYAYQTRARFPDRRVYLAGEIIHNPHVNRRPMEMGVSILVPEGGKFDYSGIAADDVVILPAFGVTVSDFAALRALGCVLVDTTCGSVLNVWKRVESYGRDGFTALIHGKYHHEETRATASQLERFPRGRYIIVRDMEEAKVVCDFILGNIAAAALMARFAPATSPAFEPATDLRRIGVANQTTMLASESLAIGEEVGAAVERAHGREYRESNFRTFDTICSATQDRQDAVKELLLEPPDVMLVVGGFNSSNTISLAMLCAGKTRTYHIEDAACIDVARGIIRHREIGLKHREIETLDWLPRGDVRVGLTAGASTPNNKIGETVATLLSVRGVDARDLLGRR
jgi:4-hydroxy-3-methylbut-2-enyl diphosphate reductase